MDNIGARWSFRVGSAIALVTFVLYVIVQRLMPPVKFITHDDQENPDVKEKLKGVNGEIEKPQNESKTEAKLSLNNAVDETADQ